MSSGRQPPARTRIKICGVRNLETALTALCAGADTLGFCVCQEFAPVH